MERIGCTTPFGLELNNICTVQNTSLEALELFLDILLNQNKAECPYPCNFLINQISVTKYRDGKNNNEIWLKFQEYISHQIYLWLH